MPEEKQELSLSAYQKKACSFNDTFDSTFRGEVGLQSGLCAEAGEVAAVTQKKIRDNMSVEIAQKHRMKELGDLLWYLAVYADHLGFDLEDIARYNIRKCEDRKQRGVVNGSGNNR